MDLVELRMGNLRRELEAESEASIRAAILNPLRETPSKVWRMISKRNLSR